MSYDTIVTHYCRANDIDISREPNVGRGPVDFKTSRGHKLKALLELKLARNTRFWNGLTRQLPKYQEAEGVRVGYFIVVVQRDKEFKKLDGIKKRVEAVNGATGYDITSTVIDARRSPPSASKL